MNANQRQWMLAATFSLIAGATAPFADAAEPALPLRDAINALGNQASTIPNDATPILKFNFPESAPKPRILDCRNNVDILPPRQLFLKYSMKKVEQERTLLPIARYVEHFGTWLAPPCNLSFCRQPVLTPQTRTAILRYTEQRDQEVFTAFHTLFPSLPRITEATDAIRSEPTEELNGQYEELQLAGIGDCMLDPAERPAPTPIMTELASTILSAEMDGLSNHDDSLIATVPEVKTFFRVAPGPQRIVVPARGAAPIPLDFAFPPVFDEGIIRQFDAPTRQAPQRLTEPPMWKWTLAMNG